MPPLHLLLFAAFLKNHFNHNKTQAKRKCKILSFYIDKYGKFVVQKYFFPYI